MSSPSKPKRQRVDLTWAEKKTICEVHKEKPSFSHLELAKYMVAHHGFRLVNRSTISRTLEESSRWLEVSLNVREGQTKRVRDAKYPQVDKAIMLWFGQIRGRRGVVTDAMLVEKATEFRDAFGISRDDFKISHGWLEKFKCRHGILCHNPVHDLEPAGASSHAQLLAIIERYDPEDVFNFDETGLYYRAAPASKAVVNDAGEPRDCVTLGLCANLPGKDRLKLIFIHKSARPRCFPAAFDPGLLVHYYSTRHAWMNADVFTAWVTGENQRMAASGRKILILLDHAASHAVRGLRPTKLPDSDLNAFLLSHVTLVFFPAHATSAVTHPLRHGAITHFKLRYRIKLLAWSLSHHPPTTHPAATSPDYGVDLLQCMVWVVGAWNHLDVDTIQNGWRAAGLLPPHWAANFGSSQAQVQSRMDDEAGELEKLLQAASFGRESRAAAEIVNWAGEDEVEAEYSTRQIVSLVENGEWAADALNEVEDGDGEVMRHGAGGDENDTERTAMEVEEARECGQKLMDFMLSQGSFECAEVLVVERICDKMKRKGSKRPAVGDGVRENGNLFV